MTTPDTRTPGELTAAPLDSYSPEDRAFFAFWYGHMKDDLMQPPLSSVSYSVARYIWDRALAARPTPASVEALKEEVKRLAGVYTDSARGILAVPSSIDWCAFTDAIDRLAAASTPPAEAQPVATRPFVFPPCETRYPAGDTCAHCGEDSKPHCPARGAEAARAIPDDEVVAFGCDEEARAGCRCEKWCHCAICPATLKTSTPPASEARATGDAADMETYAARLERRTHEMQARIDALDFEVRTARAALSDRSTGAAREFAGWIDTGPCVLCSGTGRCYTPSDLAADRSTGAVPAGWRIQRVDAKPFKRIELVAPNGYGAIVDSMARNPENMLYMLADAILASATAAPPVAPATSTGHPVQPLETASDGVLRFKENRIVSKLLEVSRQHGCGLNELAMMDFPREDRVQLAQLIGYSLDGFGSLSYVEDADYEAAGEPQPREGWKPIETAPTGVPILLTNGAMVAQGEWLDRPARIVEHRDTDGRYIDQDEFDGFTGWMDYGGGMLPAPTHWMPLPAVPQADSGAAGGQGDKP